MKMKVMILAAGRGERMRPLSETVPKPLLEAGGKPLIVHLIERLARHGFHDLIINHSHLGEKISGYLGDGSHYGVRIAYSHEAGGGLETRSPGSCRKNYPRWPSTRSSPWSSAGRCRCC